MLYVVKELPGDSMSIITVTESPRGCGWRKPGAFYLRSDGLGWNCGAMPIPLERCPVCDRGIKPSRGWTWINLADLTARKECTRAGGCGPCPLADNKIQRCGLLWIGEQFYATPEQFNREAEEMGVSRLIPAIPRDFKIGETWVALAHRKAIPHLEVGKPPTFTPGVFHVFQPTRLEYCITGKESASALEKMEKRGITLVKVLRDEQIELIKKRGCK
jgi:hypothetical protein